MLRSSIYTASALLIGASAFAQSDLSSRLHPITAPVKNAGVLNLATGHWTRHAHQANGSGPGTIYNNTCNTGFYTTFEANETCSDEGRLPSLSSPDVAWLPGVNNGSSKPGCADSYDVDGFQIGYCTDQLNFSVDLDFLDAYDSCTDLHDTTFNPGPINAQFAVSGLPASATVGTEACWIVTFDLNAPPQTASLVFNMAADAGTSGPGYSAGTDDLFGWSFHLTGTINNPASGLTGTGWIIAGDETLCAGYDGTVFGGDTTIDGTGMTTQDQFRVDTAPNSAAAGCYWFGGAPGNPLGSFHLELYQSGVVCVTEPGTSFCSPGNDIAQLCPCTGTGQIADPGHGCGNSVFNGGAILTATGTTSPDTVTFTCSDIPAGVGSIYLQGSTTLAAAVVFGDGRRCAGGQLIRLGLKNDTNGDNITSLGFANGDPQVSVTGNVIGGNTYTYQTYYRNPNPTWCPPATFNVTQGYHITW